MDTPLQILQKYWGHKAFRPLQEEIIREVLAGKDTLALLPTGGGKSICFQVPGLILPGLTLVVSPLIALMQDQVENLNKRGIAATFINSSMGFQAIDYKLNQAMKGKYKFLYLAPERLGSAMFTERLDRLNVSLLAIDEAHCISQWGYDFRPAYMAISDLRKSLAKVPVIALTATATEKVAQDILERLEMPAASVFKKSFLRENLSYHVFETENVARKILELSEKIGGSGILYARTRKRVQKLAQMLDREGISAAAYHGGLGPELRTRVQEDWLKGKARIMAATNAFGMGIDKPDVRFVIHFNLPSDLESYYQEAGRAGRDGLAAYAISFVNDRDLIELESWVKDKYPPFDVVSAHYDHLCEFFRIPSISQGLDPHPVELSQVSRRYHLKPLVLYNCLKILDKEGVVAFNETPEHYAKVRLSINPQEILAYKERFPTAAGLIDYMLRTLGGEVFGEDAFFLPDKWASKMGVSVKEIEKSLTLLAERGVINYSPPSGTPTLTFYQPRRPLTRNELNWHKYNFLRAQARERFEEMTLWVKEKTKCRARLISEYFGEKTAKNCGICDNCRKQRSNYSDRSEQELKNEVISRLNEGPVPYGTLLSSLKSGDILLRESVIRSLLDQKSIQMNEDYYLALPPEM